MFHNLQFFPLCYGYLMWLSFLALARLFNHPSEHELKLGSKASEGYTDARYNIQINLMGAKERCTEKERMKYDI